MLSGKKKKKDGIAKLVSALFVDDKRSHVHTHTHTHKKGNVSE